MSTFLGGGRMEWKIPEYMTNNKAKYFLKLFSGEMRGGEDHNTKVFHTLSQKRKKERKKKPKLESHKLREGSWIAFYSPPNWASKPNPGEMRQVREGISEPE